MASLSFEERQFLATLTADEHEKFLANYKEDKDTKEACENAGEVWNPETESAALRYLKNIKKRKELARNDAASEGPVAGTAASGAGAGLYGYYSDARLASSSTETDAEEEQDSDDNKSYLSKSDPDEEEDVKSVSSSATYKESVDNSYDSESSADYLSVASHIRKTDDESWASTPGPFAEKPLKKFPRSSFCELSKAINQTGLFASIITGSIRGQTVKIKTFHASVRGVEANVEKLETIKKIFQLDHRNLIPLLGIMDIGLHGCLQLVYASEDQDYNLLKYLRDKDLTNPKGYAAFGKISCDIIGAVEYLNKFGIVHGNLSASSVVIRKAVRSYGRNERKVHVNAFLTDYGVIQLADGKKGLYKASNGKIVNVRWVPKEVLIKGELNDYTPQSDVWSFGVLLWEIWTSGDIPYGKNRSNTRVEQDILKDCNPLTFRKPSKCPQHILDVMKSTFKSAIERPSFSDLNKRFDEFRRHKFERDTEEKETKPNFRVPKRIRVDGEEKRIGKLSSEVESPAYSKYERVREWQRQSDYRGESKDQIGKSSCATRSKGNGQGRVFTNTNYKGGMSKSKGKLPVVCVPVPVFPSGNGYNGIIRGVSQIQNLAQTLAALNLAARQNPGCSGTNNVNVNIDSQRCPREQCASGEEQTRRDGVHKRKFKKGNNKGNAPNYGNGKGLKNKSSSLY